MENYKITSTSIYSAKVDEPIVLSETGTTRKVMIANLNDKKLQSGETVGITIVHQRRGKHDEWEELESARLSSMKAGEMAKLSLDSHTTKRLYQELTNLYKIIDSEGVLFGTTDFTVAKADEIVRVDRDRKMVIEKLLSENYGEEVWRELVLNDPDLTTRLSLARIQSDRETALKQFESYLDDAELTESTWQQFFSKHTWIFGYGLDYRFLSVLEEQPDYGGSSYHGRGAQKGDFLLNTEAFTKYTVLVEIKTPTTKLVSYSGERPRIYRNGVCLLSGALLGAVSQVQMNAKSWVISSQTRPDDVIELSEKGIYTIVPKSILVIGNTEELKESNEAIDTFETFRRNTISPEIVTYDELYERARFIVNKDHIELEDDSADVY
jgi:hypothetical protein